MLLVFAVWRLTPVSVEALDFELHWYHWLVFAINIVFMAYYEGYKGFQRSYSPRVAVRAHHLCTHAVLWHRVLAPLFCMGYFHTTRRRMISAYGLTVAIVVLILIFQQLSQPWRGLLDAGVVVGLTWGTVSIIWCYLRIISGQAVPWSAELPENDSSQPQSRPSS